ncbi:hypothetical protein [Aliivibrio logei]|nr:hypothetical protein [Aliivibrio logei]
MRSRPLLDKTPLAAIGVQSYCHCTPINKAKAMTTQIIKEKINQATELADQLRKIMLEINSAACEEMTRKEKESLSATEEMLLSEMIAPSIRTASELHGRLTCLDNIYNGEA